jgi:hypothetical protein
MSNKTTRKWKYEEIIKLIEAYESGLSLQAVATKMKRSEPIVKEKLYELRSAGLIMQGKKIYSEDWSMVEDQYLMQNLGNLTATQLAGGLGRSVASIKKRITHLDSLRSTRSKNAYKRRRDNKIKQEYDLPQLQNIGYTRTGMRPHLGVSVRSSWEANFLNYLNSKNIAWNYEPKVFYFKDVVRGAKSYLPDVYLPPPVDKWIEIKGRLLSASKTKTRRFKQHYPNEFAKLEVVVKKGSEADKFYTRMGVPIYMYYDELEKNYSNIPHWEGKL